MLAAMDLREFDISRERGFLPREDPRDLLPDRFAPWEATLARLSALMTAGRLRDEVDRWPELKAGSLETVADLNRAMLLLSVVGNAYVWAGPTPATSVPETIAVPWSVVADKLGRPPILSHASVVLQNWRRLDPAGPLELDNLATQATVLGGMDEQWFYLVTVAIEAAGAPVPGRRRNVMAEQ